MLTQQQQQILDLLVNEFNKINSPKKSFKLIDTDALIDKTNKIKANDELERIHEETWDKIANEETRRIVSLLKEELPMANIEKYGEGNNNYYVLPNLFINRKERAWDTHHESVIQIGIKVIKTYSTDEFGKRRAYLGETSIKYEFNDLLFESIEALVSNEKFLERLRTHVL